MHGEGSERNILALVTSDREAVGGGSPIIFAKSEEDAANLAGEVARALEADVLLLSNGVYLIVSPSA